MTGLGITIFFRERRRFLVLFSLLAIVVSGPTLQANNLDSCPMVLDSTPARVIESGYPQVQFLPGSSSHILRGYFLRSPQGPILDGGLHMLAAMNRFLEARPDLFVVQHDIDPSGTNVSRVVLPEKAYSRDHFEKVFHANGRFGSSGAGKTMFPSHWSEDDVVSAILNFIKRQVEAGGLIEKVKELNTTREGNMRLKLAGPATVIFSDREETIYLELRGVVNPYHNFFEIHTVFPMWPQPPLAAE